MTQHFEPGDMIADFQRTAELSQQRKRSLGYEYMMRVSVIIIVDARTYTSAVAHRRWLV